MYTQGYQRSGAYVVKPTDYDGLYNCLEISKILNEDYFQSIAVKKIDKE